MNIQSNFWDKFSANKRNKYSLLIFIFFFVLSLFAEILSNDKPIVLSIDDKLYFPIFISYTDKQFGGFFDTEADYKDEFITSRLKEKSNWAIFPLNPHSYDSINISQSAPNPARPSVHNYLGTDDRGRDVLARLIYGFRLSVLFAFALTAIGIIIGIFFGAVQCYFAGSVDLYMLRFIEIWSSMP